MRSEDINKILVELKNNNDEGLKIFLKQYNSIDSRMASNINILFLTILESDIKNKEEIILNNINYKNKNIYSYIQTISSVSCFFNIEQFKHLLKNNELKNNDEDFHKLLKNIIFYNFESNKSIDINLKLEYILNFGNINKKELINHIITNSLDFNKDELFYKYIEGIDLLKNTTILNYMFTKNKKVEFAIEKIPKIQKEKIIKSDILAAPLNYLIYNNISDRNINNINKILEFISEKTLYNSFLDSVFFNDIKSMKIIKEELLKRNYQKISIVEKESIKKAIKLNKGDTLLYLVNNINKETIISTFNNEEIKSLFNKMNCKEKDEIKDILFKLKVSDELNENISSFKNKLKRKI